VPRAKWTVILCQVGAFAFQTNINLARPFRLASHLAPAVSRAPPSLDDVQSWVTEQLARYKAPDRLVVLDAMPLTAVGKVDRRELIARAEKGAES